MSDHRTDGAVALAGVFARPADGVRGVGGTARWNRVPDYLSRAGKTISVKRIRH